MQNLFCEPHKLLNIDQNEPMLVAFSGGADSSALLYLLKQASDKLNFRLYAAHVNHNIRTENYDNEAMRDESFCREACKILGIELFVGSFDIPLLAKQGKMSLESAAREARYSFFAKVMNEHNIKILATAHNADDNLETQIFNLARGCGIDGIAGIPRTRRFDKVEGGMIIRPILSASKSEIIDFCRENGIRYVTDSTNLEDECTRNVIRHKIIPELISLFGDPQASSLRLSSSAECDADFIKKTARDFLDRSSGKINISDFNSLHPAIKKRVIQLSYTDAVSEKNHLEHVHIEGIIALAQKAVENSAISLPERIRARISDRYLVFETDCPTEKAEDFRQTLEIGENFLPCEDFAVYLDKKEGNDILCRGEDNIYKLYTSAYIRSDKILMLSAKNRHEGDTVRDGGMSKKVKKLLCDKKIPLSLRDKLPIICIGDEIIYVPMCAVADSVKTDKKNSDICISIYKKPEN